MSRLASLARAYDAGILDRQRRAGGELAREPQVGVRVLAPGLGADERDRADRLALRRSGTHMYEVRLQRADDPTVLVVARRRLEQRRRNAGHEGRPCRCG